jgi:amino acid transporter
MNSPDSSKLSCAGKSETRELAHGAIGSARVTAFGVSNVAPSGAVVGGLVIVVGYAGFAAPLVVLIALVASLCCAVSIAEFARRLPSAGSLYTYNSRGLGATGGFLTGWMMVFAYALYVPAGIALTSAYASQLLADSLHVTVGGGPLFVIILASVAGVAYLGIGTSSWVDLALVAAEMAVIAALATTILVKVGPAHYSPAVLWPASSPNGQFTDVSNALIYGITAFAGFETAAALGEEASNARRSIPASTIGIVIVTGLFYLLVVCAETFGLGRHDILGLAQEHSPVGYLAGRYWSPSAMWVIDLVVVLTGLGFVTAAVNAIIRVLFAMGRERVLPPSLARLSGRRTPLVAIGCVAVLALALGLPLTSAYGGARTFGYLARAAGLAVVLIYLAVNVSAIRAFRTAFRAEFRVWPHLIIPAAAAVFLLFPLWGILHPRGWTVMDLLPFTALGWLGLGFTAAAVLRVRQPARFEALGRVFLPAGGNRRVSREVDEGGGPAESPSPG